MVFGVLGVFRGLGIFRKGQTFGGGWLGGCLLAARSETQRNGCGEEDKGLNGFHLLGVFAKIRSFLWHKGMKKSNSLNILVAKI